MHRAFLLHRIHLCSQQHHLHFEVLFHRMPVRIAEWLRHAPQQHTRVGLFNLQRAAFSFCSATLLAHTRPADEIPTPQTSQSSHELDEDQLKAEKRRKRAEYQRRWVQKKKEDPVWLEQFRKRNNESFHRYLNKISEDETQKHKHLDKMNERTRIWLQKIRDNDVLRQQYTATQRISDAQSYAASYDRRRRYAIRGWFWRNKDNIDTFAWKRWRPICLSESVDTQCATCRHRSQWGNRRLWFVRKSNPELWDCLNCFCSSDLSDIVPIQGAERFYKGIYLQPQSRGVENVGQQTETQEAGVSKHDDVEVHRRGHPKVEEERSIDREPKQP